MLMYDPNNFKVNSLIGKAPMEFHRSSFTSRLERVLTQCMHEPDGHGAEAVAMKDAEMLTSVFLSGALVISPGTRVQRLLGRAGMALHGAIYARQPLLEEVAMAALESMRWNSFNHAIPYKTLTHIANALDEPTCRRKDRAEFALSEHVDLKVAREKCRHTEELRDSGGLYY